MSTVFLTSLLLACGSTPKDSNTKNENRDAALQSLAEDLVAERYDAFRLRAEAFASAAEACDFDDLKAQWWSTREPWKHTELVGFGPVVEYPERLGPKIDDWPANENAINDLLDSDKTLSGSDFTAMGSATRGLPVIEYVLWTANDHPRACEAVQGATADVATNAAALLDAWSNRWAPAHSSGHAVLNEWVNRMGFTAQNIRELKLGKPVGDYSAGEPQPDLIESRPSGRSLQDAQDALAGIQMVWNGERSRGIRELVPDDTIQNRVDDLLVIATDRLASIPEPLETTIYDEPEIVDWAQDPLRELQGVLQRDVATALNVTVSFNDSDGD